MRKVQRPRRILFDAEMQRLHAGLPRSIASILQELQSSPSESILRLEDAAIVYSHLNGGVVRSIESRSTSGELQDV